MADSMTSAQLFNKGMVDHVLSPWWRVEHYTIPLDETIMRKAQFAAGPIIRIEEPRFYERIGEEVVKIAAAKGLKYSDRARSEFDQCSLEKYDRYDVAAYAFALWFYKLDGDNQFSFEQVLKQTQDYVKDGFMLYMYEGFRNSDMLAHPISVNDLPVVVDPNEMTATIWTVNLRG